MLQIQNPADNDVSPSAPLQVRRYAPLSLRALLIAIALSPLLIFWSEYTETVSKGADLIAMSLVMAAVAPLLVLIAINVTLKRFVPRLALTQAELLFIYTLNSTTLGICGIGMMQFLNATLIGAPQFRTPTNGYDKWMHDVPAWTVPNKSAVADYYAGHSSFFTPDHVAAWLGPILIWTGFIFVMLFCMYCMGALLRRQWVDRERLMFPITIIPLEITANGGDTPIWRNKNLWIAFGISCVLESLAAIHYSLVPTAPYLPLKPSEPVFNLGQYLTSPPWSGFGYFALGVYPLVIGLVFLLSLDVSFSCWFFYILIKLENVLCVALGFRDTGAGAGMARIPYTGEQDAGAFIAIALISIAYAWPHLRSAFRTAFMPKSHGDAEDDSGEPMRYRTAYLGLAISIPIMIAFGVAIGLNIWVSVGFFLIFLMFTITFARIRAEAGIPWGYGPPPYAHGTMVNTFGSENFSDHSLVGLAYLRWFDSDYRDLTMPNQMDAMKIAENARMNPRQLTAGVLLMVVIATLSAWVSELAIYYHYGASSAIVDSWRTAQGHYPFDELTAYLQNPKPFDTDIASWTVVGGLVTLGLSKLRSMFVWWPLNPIGFVVAGSGAMDWLWFSTFLGWMCKSVILRYGGMGIYRKVLPFFIGLVLGDYFISAVWAIFYLCTGLPGYRTFPI